MTTEIIRLGSMYFNAKPVSPGALYWPNQTIAIGNTVSEHEFQWLKDGDRLIATSNVCNDITWEQLSQAGLIFGTPVCIDNSLYLCRSLRVGAKEGEPNEWDDLVVHYGGDNDLWHWRETFFWGQEAVRGEDHLRAVRGGYSAKYFSHYDTHTRGPGIGFRPVLEPLPCLKPSLNTLLGKNIRVYGPQGHVIKGVLAEFDEYDIILTLATAVPGICAWVHKEGQEIVIDHKQVIWQEENNAKRFPSQERIDFCGKM